MIKDEMESSIRIPELRRITSGKLKVSNEFPAKQEANLDTPFV